MCCITFATVWIVKLVPHVYHNTNAVLYELTDVDILLLRAGFLYTIII